jgi:hypothetical protein
VIRWAFGIAGGSSLWISVPLVAVSMSGSVYVTTVFVQAMRRCNRAR